MIFLHSQDLLIFCVTISIENFFGLWASDRRQKAIWIILGTGNFLFHYFLTFYSNK